jgi:hypothetical protein
MEGCVEPLAEFLLNTMVRALRLHIQVDRKQGGEGQDRGPAEEPEQESAKFLHRLKATQRAIEEKMKPA